MALAGVGLVSTVIFTAFVGVIQATGQEFETTERLNLTVEIGPDETTVQNKLVETAKALEAKAWTKGRICDAVGWRKVGNSIYNDAIEDGIWGSAVFTVDLALEAFSKLGLVGSAATWTAQQIAKAVQKYVEQRSPRELLVEIGRAIVVKAVGSHAAELGKEEGELFGHPGVGELIGGIAGKKAAETIYDAATKNTIAEDIGVVEFVYEDDDCGSIYYRYWMAETEYEEIVIRFQISGTCRNGYSLASQPQVKLYSFLHDGYFVPKIKIDVVNNWDFWLENLGLPAYDTIRVIYEMQFPAEKWEVSDNCENPIGVVTEDDEDIAWRDFGSEMTGPAEIASFKRDPSTQLLYLPPVGHSVDGRVTRDSQGEPFPGGGGSPHSRETTPIVFLTSNGGLGSNAISMTIYGSDPYQAPRDGVVVEPVLLSTVERERLVEHLAGPEPQKIEIALDAYCVEFLRAAPIKGTVYRLAGRPAQEQFRSLGHFMETSGRLHQTGQFHPDSDPEAYFHSIRQWAIWTWQQDLDRAGFEEAFLEHTQRNMERTGRAWTDEMRNAVRMLVPNRWEDVQSVLRGAGTR